MICSYCGANNPDPAIFCGRCGKRVETTGYDASTVPSPPLPTVARKKNYRRRWIVLSLIGVVIFLLVTWSIFVYANRSTPTKTLETLCTALVRHDFLTAYDQFASGSVVRQETEQQYAFPVEQYDNKHADVINCTVSDVNGSGSSASGVLTFAYGDGSSIRDGETLIDENGVWKVSNSVPLG